MKYKSNIKSLKFYRKKLRNNSTSAEAELWKHLNRKQINGRKFRRQHSLGRHIVDFYCPTEKLIIELDGDSHGDYYRIEEDRIRDERLSAQGYRIIRFENRFVFQDIEWVVDEIKKTLKSNVTE